MSKSRYFSIYLLKRGFDASNALKENHRLDDEIDCQKLTEGATMYLLDSPPTPPRKPRTKKSAEVVEKAEFA
jgi:hypothetical protein